jgi:hypothetical protein
MHLFGVRLRQRSARVRGAVSLARELDYISVRAADPAATCISIHPTADRPWPFTPHEYARLLLLRSRVQALRLAPHSAGTPDGRRAP